MKGDEALRRVAGSVVGVLAAADRYLFRFGGEEFVVILPDIGEEEARRIAGALLDAVRAAAVPREDLPDRHIVTASFGVACGTGRELKDFSLIAKADRQLYICKTTERTVWRPAAPYTDEVRRRPAISRALVFCGKI